MSLVKPQSEQKLPFDIIYTIFFHSSDIRTLNSLSATCHTLHHLIESRRPILTAAVLSNHLGSAHALATSLFHLQNSGYKLNFNTVMRTHKNIVLTALGEMADEENVKAYYAYLVISLRIRKYQVPFPDEDQVLEFDAARDEDVEGMLMGIIKLATEKKVQVDRGVIDITRRWVVQAWLSRNKKSQMVRKKWARDLMRRPC